uniref:Uncharacterized protein n=1 Tax=Arundo donax TaxID=35708 RepID=A0A0A8ZSN5_ARUDO
MRRWRRRRSREGGLLVWGVDAAEFYCSVNPARRFFYGRPETHTRQLKQTSSDENSGNENYTFCKG